MTALHPATEYIDPRAKLVDEVADWLRGREPSEGRRGYAGRVRADPSGAKSLAHVMVVVPTAQSGRNLRLALAKRFKGRGLLPPRIVQPMELVLPVGGGPETVSGPRAAAAFLSFVRRKAAENGGPKWKRLIVPSAAEDARTLLGFFDQLEELWRVLGAGGLQMGDVPANPRAAEILAAAAGDETARWDELADLEAAFFAFLHERGLRHRAEEIASARIAPAPLPKDVEEIVLPALVDPVPVFLDVLGRLDGAKVTVLLHADPKDKDRFDNWGRPVPECWTGDNHPDLSETLRDGDIVRAATDATLAANVAKDFPTPGSGKEMPALGLCDDSLFADLSGCFLAKLGIELHEPEKESLSATSLGRIVDGLLALETSAPGRLPWASFARLMREDDVLRAVASASGAGTSSPEEARAAVLAGLDICQNTFLPAFVPEDAAFDDTRIQHRNDREAFKAFRAAAKRLFDIRAKAAVCAPSVPARLLAMLRLLYDGREPSEGAAGRAFSAAAKAVRETLAAFGEATDALDELLTDEDRATLLRRALSAADYSAEPDSDRVVKTSGWLELQWSDASKIALAGMHEGAVPETVRGHVFLPDKLRSALGLPSNTQRLARDAFLLREMLDAREKDRENGLGAVRAYVSRASDAGDLRRPSRLLFLVPDDKLAQRAKSLFGELPTVAAKPAREIAPGWRPNLLDSVPLPSCDKRTPEGRLSASAIDSWIKCPFSYLFRYGMGMNLTEEKEELGANDFGTLVHAVLQAYADEQLKRTKQGWTNFTDEKRIRESLYGHMEALRAKFGRNPSTRVDLQLDAAWSRLMAFAKVQAFWAKDGWVVKDQPEYPFCVRPFEGEGEIDVWIKGSIDRIDYKEGVGYRLIDYKTWDEKGKADGHILSKGRPEAEHAAALGLQTLPATRKNSSPRRLKTVQLPLYARCLAKDNPATFGGDAIVDYCYLVLGKDEANTCVLGSAFDHGELECQSKNRIVLKDLEDIALDTAKRAIRGIRANLFWPPGPGPLYDLDDLFQFSHKRDLEGTPWLEEQKRRLAAFSGKGGLS